MSRGPRRIGKLQRKHRLSLCMIVKNEAETLEKCLRLARPHVDEIVVVDTGSTDGTQEIARRYADVYDEIEWPDSFALARNYSLDKATGDYILILDGDEYIEEDVYWRRIHKALRDGDLAAVQFPVKNLLGANQLVAADRMWQERVLRNDSRLRYIGKVHHQIKEVIEDYVAATQTRVIQVEAEVIHTGYAHDPDQMRRKYEPRVKLLQEEYYNPRSEVYRAYYGFQLGVAYFVLRRYEDALEVLNEVNYARMTPQNAFYTHLLAAQSALKLSNPAVALVHCNHMLTLSRIEPVAYYTTGLALLMGQKIGDGILMLLEALDIHEAAGINVRFVMNPQAMFRTLASICGKTSLGEHERVFSALAEKETYNPKVVRALISSLKTGIVMAEYEKAA